MSKHIGLVVLLISLAFTGCSHEANIKRTDGTWLSGEISGSTPSTITVDAQDGPTEVSRDDVELVRHPGSGAIAGGATLATTGGISAMLGALLLVASSKENSLAPEHREPQGKYQALGSLALIGGFGGLVGGTLLAVNGSRAKRNSKSRAEVALSPALDHPGLVATLRF